MWQPFAQIRGRVNTKRTPLSRPRANIMHGAVDVTDAFQNLYRSFAGVTHLRSLFKLHDSAHTSAPSAPMATVASAQFFNTVNAASLSRSSAAIGWPLAFRTRILRRTVSPT